MDVTSHCNWFSVDSDLNHGKEVWILANFLLSIWDIIWDQKLNTENPFFYHKFKKNLETKDHIIRTLCYCNKTYGLAPWRTKSLSWFPTETSADGCSVPAGREVAEYQGTQCFHSKEYTKTFSSTPIAQD